MEYDIHKKNVIGLKHYIHLLLEKSLKERVITANSTSIRIESKVLMITLSMYSKRSKMDVRSIIYVHDWIQFFISMYNDTIYNKNYFIIQLQEEVMNLS